MTNESMDKYKQQIVGAPLNQRPDCIGSPPGQTTLPASPATDQDREVDRLHKIIADLRTKLLASREESQKLEANAQRDITAANLKLVEERQQHQETSAELLRERMGADRLRAENNRLSGALKQAEEQLRSLRQSFVEDMPGLKKENDLLKARLARLTNSPFNFSPDEPAPAEANQLVTLAPGPTRPSTTEEMNNTLAETALNLSRLLARHRAYQGEEQ